MYATDIIINGIYIGKPSRTGQWNGYINMSLVDVVYSSGTQNVVIMHDYYSSEPVNHNRFFSSIVVITS